MNRFSVLVATVGVAFGGPALADEHFQQWEPSFGIQLAFSGANAGPARFHAQIASTDLRLAAEQAAPALFRMDFAPGVPVNATVAGLPMVGYRLASNETGEAGFFASNWKVIALGGLAAVALAASGGGGGGDEGDTNPADARGVACDDDVGCLMPCGTTGDLNSCNDGG